MEGEYGTLLGQPGLAVAYALVVGVGPQFLPTTSSRNYDRYGRRSTLIVSLGLAGDGLDGNMPSYNRLFAPGPLVRRDVSGSIVPNPHVGSVLDDFVADQSQSTKPYLIIQAEEN